MRLLVAHKILIGAFIVMCVVLLVRGIRLYAALGSTQDLVLGMAAVVVAVGLGVYLRRIWNK